MDTNEKVKKGRIIILQAMLDTYLRKNGKPPASETFSDEKDIYGKLNKSQYLLLHFYLADEFKTLGLDLSEEIKKHGETVTPGKLTKFELDELTRRVDEMLLVFATVQERKERLSDK